MTGLGAPQHISILAVGTGFDLMGRFDEPLIPYASPMLCCSFNQLDLPEYESYEQLRSQLLLAVRECSEGFGFA